MTKIAKEHPEVIPYLSETFKKAKIVETLDNMKILEGNAKNGRIIRFIVDEQLGKNGKIIRKTFLNNAYFKK